MPVRARGAETALASGNIEKAIAALASDLTPTDDVHASAAARRQFAGVLLARVAKQLRGAKA
jgi:carbon-monoxide dehydrogenase medium subunit